MEQKTKGLLDSGKFDMEASLYSANFMFCRQTEETLSSPEIIDTRTAESGTKKDPDENKYKKETKKLSTWMALGK